MQILNNKIFGNKIRDLKQLCTIFSALSTVNRRKFDGAICVDGPNELYVCTDEE